MTIAAALADAINQLAAAGVETPRYDAQLLLTWILKARREELAREPERLLAGREQIIFEKAVRLRAERRPLAYITGEAWFYGRAFKINRAVLIPRPETELLAELTLKACDDVQNPKIADIGTGSGCLAVTLACERPDAQIWATDFSSDALTLARKNVVRYGRTDRVTLCEGDLLGPLPPGVCYTVIVSNPPYVTEAELPDLQPEVRDYEPRLALSGLGSATGVSGTALHRRILSDARPVLKPGGWVLLEVGQGQAEDVAEAARALGYGEVAIENDFSEIGRVVTACFSESCS